MVSINVSAGQGMTQAIASKLDLSKDDLKKINLTTWQKVLTEVKNAQADVDKANSGGTNKKESIFTGGNDVQAVAKSSGWKNNFVVKQGDIKIDDGVWAKIANLLKPGSVQPEKVEQKTEITPQNPKLLEGEIPAIKIDTKTPEAPKTLKTLKPSVDENRAVTEKVVESLDGKFLTREVDGKKEQIAIVDTDGGKVRRVVNEDQTLGDTLVPISTAGKNKYITQTEFENKMRTALGIEQGQTLPDDIKGEFVNIGGSPTLIFKKDGKTLDQAALREYVKELHANDKKEDVANSATTNEAKTVNVNGQEYSVIDLGTGKMYKKDNQIYFANSDGSVGDAVDWAQLLTGKKGPIPVSDVNQTKAKPKMNAQELQKYFDNDDYLKDFENKLPGLSAQASRLQNDNDEAWKSGDLDAINQNGGLEAFDAKSNAQNLEKAIKEYKSTLSEWQDGSGITYKTGTLTDVPLERVTMKDGQKAYKAVITENGRQVTKYFGLNIDPQFGFGGSPGACIVSDG